MSKYIKRNSLSKEEQALRTKGKIAAWNLKEWKCPDCGLHTKNGCKYSHKRHCKNTDITWTSEQLQRIEQTKAAWRNKHFVCQFCGKCYKNASKYLHMKLCEKKHRMME